MRKRLTKLQSTLCVAILLSSLFLIVAAFGKWRETRDVKEIRAYYQEIESEFRTSIAEIGDGVPLDTFKELLPYAGYSDKNEEWVVRIPTDYTENPSSTNIYIEHKYFQLEDDIVRPVEFKSGGGHIHADRFGLGGVLYYFGRAWYSSTQYYILPSDTE
jgi:hypothetical protein